MARVLLAWELGGGLGHVKALGEIARLLVPAHRVTLALQSTDSARCFLSTLPVRVREAPRFDTERTRPLRQGLRFSARDHADVLAYHGFADPALLAPQLAAWDEVLREESPDLCVADGSPALCLAARGRIPALCLGAGFSVPPSGERFPMLQPGRAPLVEADRLVDAVERVLHARGHTHVPTLPTLIAGDAQLVRTLPELDPYRAHRPVPAAGPLEPLAPPQPEAAPRTFALYLSSRSPFRPLLAALTTGGFRGRAYVRGLAATEVDAARRAGWPIEHTPLDLARELSRVGLVIHHGGANVAAEALAAGRAQLVYPQHLEQALTARALVDLGVGVCGAARRLRAGDDARLDLERALTLLGRAHRVALDLPRRCSAGPLATALRGLGLALEVPVATSAGQACP